MQNSTENYQGFFLIKPDGIRLFSKIQSYLQEYIYPNVMAGGISFYKIHDFSFVFRKVQVGRIKQDIMENYLSFMENNFDKEAFLLLLSLKCKNDDEYLEFLKIAEKTKSIIRKRMGGLMHPCSDLLEECPDIDKYLSVIHTSDANVADARDELQLLKQLGVFNKNNLLNTDEIK